jgi:predicted nucleic acid-binding protein
VSAAADELPFGGRRLVIDMSAFTRANHPDVRDDWVAAALRDQLHVGPLFRLEALYATADLEAFDARDHGLASLPNRPLTVEAAAMARVAMRRLREQRPPYRHVPIADVLTAAVAVDHGLGVLHYDAHYDCLAAVMGFESVWLAPPGTLA